MMDPEQEQYRDEIIEDMKQLADQLVSGPAAQDELDTFLDPRRGRRILRKRVRLQGPHEGVLFRK